MSFLQLAPLVDNLAQKGHLCSLLGRLSTDAAKNGVELCVVC